MSGPAIGSTVLVGLTAATVAGVREDGALLEVVMPSGRTMVCEPCDVFDPAALT